MSKSSNAELVNSLSSFKDYGFTQLQAAAYIAALSLEANTGATGSAIAGASGINRSKIYDILAQLEEMGAIEVVPEDGKNKYRARPPEEVLGEIMSKFSKHMDEHKSKLMALSKERANIDPAMMTLTKLKLKRFDLNKYNYLISSNELGRSYLLDYIAKKYQPGFHVKILNLNDNRNAGYIIVANDEEVYIFAAPMGSEVDALRFNDPQLASFLMGLIESRWAGDIPDAIMDEIEAGTLRAVHSGKSLYMQYRWHDGREYVYDRPVSYLITDTHLTFLYLGEQEPKLPLFAIHDIKLRADDTMIIECVSKAGKALGTLEMRTVEKQLFLKNLLLTLAEKNRN